MERPPRLRLTDDEVAVACALLTAPRHALLARSDARAALPGLRRAGALDDKGALAEPAASIVRVVALPMVRLEARVWTGDAIAEHRAWADERDAVAGDVRGDAVDLTLIPCARLPLALALRLGLARAASEPRGDRRTLPLSPGALATVRELTSEGDGSAAVALLSEQGLDRDAASRVVDLAHDVRRVWSVSASWREADGNWHPGSLTALNAGSSGWWELRHQDSVAALMPSDPESLWSRMLALLPG